MYSVLTFQELNPGQLLLKTTKWSHSVTWMALPGSRNNLLPAGHFWQGSKNTSHGADNTEACSRVRKLITPLEGTTRSSRCMSVCETTYSFHLLVFQSFYASHHHSISKFTPSFCSPKTDYLQFPPLLQKSSVLICTSFLPTKWDLKWPWSSFLFHKKREFLCPQGGSEWRLLVLFSSAIFTMGREHFLFTPHRGEITDHGHVRPRHSR